nr:PREDICTED: hyphally regulated cell wall protein 3-like [Stegastes partitus]
MMFKRCSLLLLVLLLDVQLYSAAPIQDQTSEDNADPDEPPPSTPEEEISVILIPAEPETEDQTEPAEEETAPEEDPAVIVPVDSAEEEQETAEEEEPPEEEEEALLPIELEENVEEDLATDEEHEEESVVVFPAERETEEEGEAAAEETTPEESPGDDLVVLVPLNPGEEDLEQELLEESVLVDSPEEPEEEAAAPETDSVAQEVPVPVAVEEDTEEDPATNEETLPSSPEEDESLVLVPVEPETEGEEQVEPVPEEPAVIVVVVEPTDEEPAPEDAVLITPLEDPGEDGPEEHTAEEEEVVPSDPLPEEPAQEEETSEDPVILTVPVTESTDEAVTLEEASDPVEDVPAAPTEIITEAEPVTGADGGNQTVPAAVEAGNHNHSHIRLRGDDFIAAVTLIEDEPVVLLNRGAVLGAAFFTLMSFIVDPEVKVEQLFGEQQKHRAEQVLLNWILAEAESPEGDAHTVMAITGGTLESLDDIPAQVWKGLPDCLNLRPSAVNQSRIGVWATRVIPKGKRFGPFVGEKKKRSQVTSNVYMWEVYFPARGWMCVDATDPTKGNWLRYVNWARSSEEQNLFPLEINRAIYYKVLRPIGPGEELLVWYTVEDNPEITAALEEERASSLSRRNSPRAKRGEALPTADDFLQLVRAVRAAHAWGRTEPATRFRFAAQSKLCQDELS